MNNKSVTKTNILIYRFSTRYVKHVSLRCQLRNSLGLVFWTQDHILFSRLWTLPSGLVPRVSCLIASSLSIIINFFCGPYRGMLFFYSSCLLYSGSSAFSKTGLNILKFTIHVLLKPGLENFEHYFTSVWDECICALVWIFFGIAFLWDWNENWPFPVLWPLLSFSDLLTYWVQHFHSTIF